MYLSIIIVNYNVYKYLIKCIGSIKENLKTFEYEIIVIDNNSPDKSIEKLQNVFPDIKLLKLENNIGFGAANNYAVKHSSGKYLLLLNPDIIIQNNCIQKLLNYMEGNDNIGVTAPALFKPNGEFDYYNSFFPSIYSILMLQFSLYNSAKGMLKKTFEFFDNKINEGIPFQVEQAIGACVLMRKSIFEEFDGFDEAFFIYQEETDLEFRMSKKGWKIMILPDAKAIHFHHASTGELGNLFISFHWLRSIIIYFKKNFGFFTVLFLSFTMLISLIFRELKYLFIYFIRPKIFLEVTKYTLRLVGLNFMTRNSILKNRFKFNISH
jgi:GT2 family glycosyltransferase